MTEFSDSDSDQFCIHSMWQTERGRAWQSVAAQARGQRSEALSFQSCCSNNVLNACRESKPAVVISSNCPTLSS